MSGEVEKDENLEMRKIIEISICSAIIWVAFNQNLISLSKHQSVSESVCLDVP